MTSPRAIKAAVVTLAALVVAAVIYGTLSDRRGRAVTIDLSTSIDHRVVFPMAKNPVIITHPGRIDLRLPTGREYHRDGALEVWIIRTEEGDPNLIHEILINTQHETPDEVYADLAAFQEQWGMGRSPRLDRWYEKRKQQPYVPFEEPVIGWRSLTGISVNGRPFRVEFDLRGGDYPGDTYQVIEEFVWGGA